MTLMIERLVACAVWVPALALSYASAQEAKPPASAWPTQCLAIGGAMKDDNADLMRWMSNGGTADRIIIIGYATSKPEGADTRMAACLEKFGWKGTAVLLPDVLKGAGERKAAVDSFSDARLIFMTGGDQSRIMERFRAAPELRTALDERMTRHGTPVAGSSAGAAVMSNPMFTGGGSESALAGGLADDGEKDEPAAPGTDGDKPAPKTASKRGVQMGEGLGIVAPIIDTHFFQRGRVGRLVAGLEKSGVPFGIGIGENRAVSVRDSTRCTVIGGDCAALLVDVRELKRVGNSRLGVRIGLLSSGDKWHWPQKDEVYAFVRSPRELWAGAVGIAAPALAADAPLPDAWGKNVTLDMLKRLAADPSKPQRAQSKGFEVVISADNRTKFGWEPGRPDALTVVEAKLDIVERKSP